MSFGIYTPLAEPYFAYGTFQDHESMVPDLDHCVEVATRQLYFRFCCRLD